MFVGKARSLPLSGAPEACKSFIGLMSRSRKRPLIILLILKPAMTFTEIITNFLSSFLRGVRNCKRGVHVLGYAFAAKEPLY